MNFRIKIFLALLVCVQTACAFGQKTKMVYYEKLEDFMPSLKTSRDSFHFRFSTNDQVVDIWSGHGVVNGYVINYAEQTVPKPRKHKSATDIYFLVVNYGDREEASDGYIINKQAIDTGLSRRIYGLILTISSIPTQGDIPGWAFVSDGKSYHFETIIDSVYSSKWYSSPNIQPNDVMEAKVLSGFIDSFSRILKLSERYNDFQDSLPSGHYARFIKFTPQEVKDFRKAKAYFAYLYSVKDTLNRYLSDTLTARFAKQPPLEIRKKYGFILHFSAKNKLMDVTTEQHFYWKEDRQQYQKNRAVVWKACKNLNLDFVHSQIDYKKVIKFDNGKVEVSDPSDQW